MSDEPCTGEPAIECDVLAVKPLPDCPAAWLVERLLVQVVDFYREAGRE